MAAAATTSTTGYFFSAMQKRLRLKNCELFFAFVRLFDIPLLNPAVVVDVFGVLVPISHTHTHTFVCGGILRRFWTDRYLLSRFSLHRGEILLAHLTVCAAVKPTDGSVCVCRFGSWFRLAMMKMRADGRGMTAWPRKMRKFRARIPRSKFLFFDVVITIVRRS